MRIGLEKPINSIHVIAVNKLHVIESIKQKCNDMIKQEMKLFV